MAGARRLGRAQRRGAPLLGCGARRHERSRPGSARRTRPDAAVEHPRPDAGRAGHRLVSEARVSGPVKGAIAGPRLPLEASAARQLVAAANAPAAILVEGWSDHAELASFGSFQKQPAQQGRDDHAQLRRFMGTRSGRKIRYGALLIDALDLDRVPRPLDKVLAHVRG